MGRYKDHVMMSLIATAASLLLVPILFHISERGTPLSTGIIVGFVVGVMLLSNVGIFVAYQLEPLVPALFQFTKFFVTGVFNFALDASIFNILVFFTGLYVGWPILAFSLFTFSVTLCTSYFINRSWSFGHDAKPSLREFGTFTSFTLVSLALNLCILFYMTTLVGPPIGIPPAVWINIAKLVCAGVSMVWNFIAFKFFVFKK